MKKILLSSLAISSLFLFSCQKESSDSGKNDEKSLLGSWKLLNIDFEGELSSEISSEDMGSAKNAIFMDYLSTNNKGGITFEESKLISDQLSYDIEGTVTSKIYVNNVLINSYDSVINISMPPSSSTVDYVRVGTDSIYCPNGAFLQIEGADDLESEPMGFKYKIDGDKLIMTIKEKESEVQTEDGMTQEDKSDMTLIATFQKQ